VLACVALRVRKRACAVVCMGVCMYFHARVRVCMHGGSCCGHRFVATQTDVLNVEEVQNPFTVEVVVP
jgi:hypothetical protein